MLNRERYSFIGGESKDGRVKPIPNAASESSLIMGVPFKG